MTKVVQGKTLSSGNEDIDKLVADYVENGFDPELCIAESFAFAVKLKKDDDVMTILSCNPLSKDNPGIKVYKNGTNICF